MPFLGRGSPGLRSPAAGILLAVTLAFSVSTAAAKTRRQRAGDYYKAGIAQLEKLMAEPERSRSSDDYLKVIRTLGRVHATSPASGYNDDALLKIGDLYREMSQRYEAEPFRTRAVETYKFLIHDYPYSKLLDKARESISEIESARKAELARQADPPPPAPVSAAQPEKKSEPAEVSSAVRRQRGNDEPDAEDAYQAAIRLLDDFRSVPEAEMGVLQYQLVADAFEEAYDASPSGEHAAEALAEMAGMYRDMAARFGEESYGRRATEAYRKLVAGFPQSDEAAAARKTLASLGKAVETAKKTEPKASTESSKRAKAAPVTEQPTAAPEIGAKNAAPDSPEREVPSTPHDAPSANATLTNATLEAASVEPPGETVVVRNMRHWSHPQYTRVAIELDARAPFEYDRVPNPERVYFDFKSALISAELNAHSTITVDDRFVKSIRIAQNQESVVRVVFDLKSHAFFGASWLTNPTRLLIELRATEEPVSFAKSEQEQLADKPVRWARNNLGPAVRAEQADLASSQLPSANASIAGKPVIDANDAYRMIEAGLQSATDLARQTLREIDPGRGNQAEAPKPASSKAASPTPAPGEAAKSTIPPETKSVVEKKAAEVKTPAGDEKPAAAEAKVPLAKKKSAAAEAKTAADTPAATRTPADKEAPKPDPNTLAKLERKIEPPPLENPAPPKAADATSRGNRNLVRALGLKVGRVVIDAGHGGHDVGTIGPSGLYEKDVVLDVAMRLGKLIQERLGAEVYYTRTDDRYVTFNDRTKLANDNGADLFISIHANSARSRGVRGVETYYLNLKGDPWAMAVASRENAASDHSIHELQGLVSKIALNEKIEESREFATRIQKELFDGLSADSKSLRDRGVRKAPFLVLLGAKMPAVLAEIAFISNPTDEKLLKTTKFRQEIAEHLFEGINGYADSLGSTSLAQKKEPEGT